MGRKRIERWQHIFCRTAHLPRILLLIGLLPVYLSYAQPTSSRAAVLAVMYPGVELRRDNTEQWIELPVNAVMPVGVGDSLRTDGTGRADIAVLDSDAEMVMLSNAKFTFTDFSGENPPAFALELAYGEIIHRFDAGTFSSYNLTAGPHHLRFPSTKAAHILTRYTPELARTVYVSAASGSVYVELSDDGGGAQVEAVGTVLRGVPPDERTMLLANLVSPLNPAEIEGEFSGCTGTVQTETGSNLNARIGPGTTNPQLGQFPSESPVQVMGIVESGGWYRVQFRGGFGWVERLAVTVTQPDCNLPTLPDSAYDLPNQVYNITDAELTLLQPFYGMPEDDPIFYQTVVVTP